MCLGIPGQIVEIENVEEQRGVADVEGVRRHVSLALLGIRDDHGEVITDGMATGLEAVGVGDWVLIHVGFAMSRIDEAEAKETMRALKLFSGLFEEELAEFGADDLAIRLDPNAPPPPLIDPSLIDLG